MRALLFILFLSLGSQAYAASQPPMGCLPGQLKLIVHQLKRYGKVTVISTLRKGAKVAGTKRVSKHASCQAVDIRIQGKKIEALKWLRTLPIDVITYKKTNHIHLGYGGHYRGRK